MDPAFDRITELAADLLDTPLCFVSLIDETRTWFKSASGIDVTDAPRGDTFCSYTILGDETLVIEDATKDPRAHDNPFVTGEHHVRAYAGHPLILSGGEAVGSLCVVDTQPRTFTDRQLAHLRSLAGQVTKLLELLREQRIARDATMEARSLRETFEHHVLFCEIDRSGTVTDVNDAFCEVTGYSRGELVGSPHEIISSGLHPASFWAEMWDSIGTGTPWRGEVCNRSKSGDLYWVDTTNIPSFGSDGRIERFYSIGLEITEKKQAESENLLLGTAFERFPDAAIITNPEGVIVSANPAAVSLCRRHRVDPSVGAQLELFSPQRTGSPLLSRLLVTARDGEQFSARSPIQLNLDISLPVLTKGAVPERPADWLDISATPILDAVGSVSHVLIIARDITREVEREQDARLRAEGAEARAKIGSILSSTRPIGERLHAAVEVVLNMTQLDVQKKGGLFTLDPGDKYLRMRTHVGEFTHEFLQNESQVKLGSCLCGRAALSGEIIVSDNCFEDDRHEHSWPGMSAHGHYIVPLMDSGKCVGVLFLYTDVNPSRSAARLEALEQIGQLFANTIVSERSAQLISAATRRLQEAQIRFELALEGSRDAILDWDIPSGKVYYSSRWAELLRCDDSEVAPTISSLLSHIAPEDVAGAEESLFRFVEEGEDHFELEFRLVTDDGAATWVLFRAAAIRDDSDRALRITGSVADISKIKNAEEQVRRMVQQDQLTGLASRSRLMERLEAAVAKAQGTHESCALLFFDFDRFKVVNDSLGHDVGDELLCSIANRLRSEIRAEDLAARLGGDEFVILLERIESSESARATAEKLLRICGMPHTVRGHRLVSTASIGLVTSEHSSGSAPEMLRDADAAMYAAKANGRGCVIEFDKAMHDASLDRLALEDDLRRALEDRAFELHYQPIVNLESGHTVGAEALLRWTHPTRGPISPAVFIPIAEESNLIRDIGWWVIDEACAQALDWKTRGVMPPEFRLSINVSKAQLLCPDFTDRLTRRVRSHGLETTDLKLEVTETTIVDNRAGVSCVLDELRSRGFVVMMDDFGTGHSSLSGLHTLPIDELKIDQSFIRHDNASRDIIAITSSIVTLADHLRLRTVGEGIESVHQIALLQNLGCHYGQGYYFSKPVPAPELEQWIHENRRARAA